MDKNEVFDWSNGTLPFLLLDWHQSQIQLLLLNFINNNQHKWMVCVGAPYFTHKWQVHDASAMNGVAWKMLFKAKQDYLSHCDTLNFCWTNVILFVWTAFSQSFAVKNGLWKQYKAVVGDIWIILSWNIKIL